MSDTMINWRFGAYHLQVLHWRNWWCARGRIIRWHKNWYHGRGMPGRAVPGWRWVDLYEGRGYAVALALIAAAALIVAVS